VEGYRRSGGGALIETPEGRVLFYPDGIFTRPYVLSGARSFANIRRFVWISRTLSWFLILVFAVLREWRIALVLIAIFLLIYEIGVRIFLRIFDPAPKRLSLRDGYRIRVLGSSLAELEGRLLLLLSFAGVSGYLVWTSKEDRTIGVIATIMALAAAGILAQMVRTKKTLDHEDSLSEVTPDAS